MIDATPHTPALSPSLTRTAGAAARELKFLVREEFAGVIANRMRGELDPDPYARGPNGDDYTVSTLYYDTPEMHILRGDRRFGRSKWRIRRYSEEDAVFLERKLRADGMLYKRRTRVAPDELERLDQAPAHDPEPGWAGDWFRTRMMRRAMRPVCEIRYDRIARQTVTRDGLARMTLDTGLHYAAAGNSGFRHAADRPLIAGMAVVELKFHHAPPAVFKSLLESFPIVPARFSKYRTAAAHLRPDITHPYTRES